MSQDPSPAATTPPGGFAASVAGGREGFLAPVLNRLTFGRVAWTALVALTLAVVVTNISGFRDTLDAFAHANPFYLLAAAGFQAAFLVNLGLYYQSSFAVLGLRAPFRRFALLGAGGYFVNLVSKTSGLGGVALYLSEGSRRGFQKGRTITAYMVTVVLGHVAYFVTLALALVLLYVSGTLKPIEAIAAAVMTVLLLIVFGAIVFVTTDRRRLAAAWGFGHRLALRFKRLFGATAAEEDDTAMEAADELYEAVSDLRREPARYAQPLAHALLVEALGIGVLFTTARALGANITPAQAVIAYAVAVLSSMIAITPSGLGFVEASLAGLLVSFGVPLHHAVAAGLAYRFFEFWLPIIIGSIAVRALAVRKAPA